MNRKSNSSLGLGIKTEFLRNIIYVLAYANIIKILSETKRQQPYITSNHKKSKLTKADFSTILLYYYTAQLLHLNYNNLIITV